MLGLTFHPLLRPYESREKANFEFEKVANYYSAGGKRWDDYGKEGVGTVGRD